MIGLNDNDTFKKLNIFKVRDVIKMNQLRLVYDFLNSQLPDDLMSLFRLSRDVHQNLELNSSVNYLIHIPTIHTTTYGNQSIRYRCAKLWNEVFKNGFIRVKDKKEKNNHILLSSIKNTFNFKNALKKHVTYMYSVEDNEDFLFYWHMYYFFSPIYPLLQHEST